MRSFSRESLDRAVIFSCVDADEELLDLVNHSASVIVENMNNVEKADVEKAEPFFVWSEAFLKFRQPLRSDEITEGNCHEYLEKEATEFLDGHYVVPAKKQLN